MRITSNHQILFIWTGNYCLYTGINYQIKPLINDWIDCCMTGQF